MTDINMFHLILKSELLIKLVILILICFSIISWGIIVQRLIVLISAKNEALVFEDKFWSGIELSRLYQEGSIRNENLRGAEQIFNTGFKEFVRLHHINNHSPKAIVDGAARAMRISMNREIEALETHIPLLEMVGSISLYIGLFNTVWGIMNAFIELSSVKQNTLQMIAPRIAEALIATVIGLLTAIPAIIAFNYLSLRVNKLRQKYDNFTEEFIVILYRQASDNNSNSQVS